MIILSKYADYSSEWLHPIQKMTFVMESANICANVLVAFRKARGFWRGNAYFHHKFSKWSALKSLVKTKNALNRKCWWIQNDGGFIISVLPLRCELKSTTLKYSADTFISSQSCIIFKASIMHERQINQWTKHSTQRINQVSYPPWLKILCCICFHSATLFINSKTYNLHNWSTFRKALQFQRHQPWSI